MIAKALGAVMIVLSCLGASRTLSSYDRKKLCQLDSFIALIRYIRNRIDCYSEPIDRIFSACPEDIMEPLGGKEPLLSFRDLMGREEVVLEGEGRRLLDEFASSFGKNYRDRQLRLCDSTVSALEALRDSEKKVFVARRKTVNALCLAVGGMAIILLL